MKIIDVALQDLNRPEYRSDSERIVRVAFQHGYVLNLRQAEIVWEFYSDSMAAGWMNLPHTDEELWEIIGAEV